MPAFGFSVPPSRISEIAVAGFSRFIWFNAFRKSARNWSRSCSRNGKRLHRANVPVPKARSPQHVSRGIPIRPFGRRREGGGVEPPDSLCDVVPRVFGIERHTGELIGPGSRPTDNSRSRLREAYRERCPGTVVEMPKPANRHQGLGQPGTALPERQFVNVIEYQPVPADGRSVPIAQVPIIGIIRASCIVDIIQTARELVLSLE
jgi:hypothetical protein